MVEERSEERRWGRCNKGEEEEQVRLEEESRRGREGCYTPGNDSGVRGTLAVVGLTCIVETGYWALRAELMLVLIGC